ncbi:Ubiquinone biosynthesis O-methyltransferase [compost metagenome]
MFQLERNGYVFNKSLGIWARPEYPGIAYSDGDSAEQRIGRIIKEAEDVSVFSTELRRQCTDWLTIYHLSSQRSNVLRPFDALLKGKVLEVGAGCGAISRYLGETGGQILALEGSPRRAAIAASRTRDLDNITVLAERFDNLQTDELFDAITLIGVMEYANMFSSGETPALNMLKKVRSLLKPNGHLFIAIENQLGLKYFAGAPEDHLGQVMYGIEGRYQQGQPQTYGRHALTGLIAEAGYSTIEFLAPFPDYKVPKSIITEQGCSSRTFDAAALAWQNVKADPQLPSETHFDLLRAWPTVFSNNLGMELSNSFIVAASVSRKKTVEEHALAYHYNTERNACFCKETKFVQTGKDEVVVFYRHLSTAPDDSDAPYQFKLPEQDVYRVGRLLSQEFIELFSTPNWSIEKASILVRNYLSHLETILIENGHLDSSLDNSTSILPGDFLDALPHNIIISPDGTPQLFDTEWKARDGIELGHLLCRGLLHLLLTQSSNIEPLNDAPNISRQDLIETLLAAAGIFISKDDFERFSQAELGFMQLVFGPAPERGDIWSPSQHLTPIPMMQACIYFSSNDQEFTEGNSLKHPLTKGRQNIKFKISTTSEAIDRLRFDPIAQPHWFSLHDIRITDQNNQILWHLSDAPEKISLIGIHRALTSTNGSLYYAESHDPQILIPFSPQKSEIFILIDIELLESPQIATKLIETEQTADNISRKLSETEKRELSISTECQRIAAKLSESDRARSALAERVGELASENQAIKSSTTWKIIQRIARAKSYL